MFVDYFYNGQAYGPAGDFLQMAGTAFDPGFLRPYLDDHGNRCVTINTGKMVYNNATQEYHPERKSVLIQHLLDRGMYHPTWNATSLRKQEWQFLDQKVLLAARQRLRAWSDLASRNTFGGFDGFAKMTFEYEAQSDPGEAQVDMTGLSEGRGDSPLFKLRSIPLPITHGGFSFDKRRLASSRMTGMPLDTTMAEAVGRRIAEKLEQTLIGTITGVTYGTISTGPAAHDGTSSIYGYTNFPNRLTKTDLTTPTGDNPDDVLQDILAMRQSLYDNRFYGPFMLYHSNNWDTYLDDDYGRVSGTDYGFNPTKTLRNRIREIEGIEDVRRLDFLEASDTNPFTLILIQMTSDVARIINGMSMMTLQWETQGGMEQHFQVMTIQVPQIRYDYNGRAGIIHGTTS